MGTSFVLNLLPYIFITCPLVPGFIYIYIYIFIYILLCRVVFFLICYYVKFAVIGSENVV